MATTTHMGVTLLEQAQAQKEVTVNEAFKRLDALLNSGAISASVVAPPDSPQEGDVYIVPDSATGVWQGKTAFIAYFDQIWRFIPPSQGAHMLVQDINALMSYSSSGWSIIALSPNEITELGVNASADTTNKLVVRSDAALFTAETDNIRILANKNALTATASHVFQDNYSGRAEFGLLGSDHFSLKVSADGSNFTQALSVDNTDGAVEISRQLNAPASLHRHSIWIQAAQCQPTLANGCGAHSASAQAANQPDIVSCPFLPV